VLVTSILWNDNDRGKGLEHEAEHTPPSGAEVKNKWRYTAAPSYAFMVWITTTLVLHCSAFFTKCSPTSDFTIT
jgi:hypothetical protein